jgi:hypothetical protein
MFYSSILRYSLPHPLLKYLTCIQALVKDV